MSARSLTALAALAAFSIGQPAVAQDGPAEAPRGYLAFSAGYSERHKESLGIEFVGENLFRSNVDLRFGGQRNALGHQWTAEIARSGSSGIDLLGTTAELEVGLTGQTYAWDDALFDSERVSLYATLGVALSQRARLDIMAELYRDTISDVDAKTSPLIADEAGRVDSFGLSVTYSSGTLQRRSGRGGFLQLDAYGLAGTAKWVGVSGGYEAFVPLGGGFITRLAAEGGAARGLGGYELRVTDRAFLPTSQLRGFAFGGVGPVDKTGDTTTPLGGRKYATASIEAGREVYAFDAGSVFVSAFWDAGSVWDLPTTQGGFGAIDDSAHLRQSAGLAVDVETRYGILSLAYAEPLQRRPDDRLQALSVAFRLGF